MFKITIFIALPKISYNLNNLYDHFTAMDEYLLKDARRRVLEEEVEEKKEDVEWVLPAKLEVDE